jgi:formate--tetrahydrofolate ligase
MLSDLRIARSSKIKPITQVARKLGINKRHLKLYGEFASKISLDAIKGKSKKKNGKYIVVTCVTPTPLGEGKTITTIGLSMALNSLKKKAACCIRQPSLGPVFGIKGGAAGGGYAQAIPMEDLNLHFTGDTHAVGAAHNLCAAFLDNSLYRKNPLGIDPRSVSWRRVIDISDRSLRNIRIGLGKRQDGVKRDSGFDITGASEIMAILSLSKDYADLRRRLRKIVVGFSKKGRPVTAGEIKAAGAMAVLLKDALLPNLIQTLDNTPCFVHTGPFANIAHGNSSVLADMMALKSCDYVITESGFGSDCGAEKFFDIKCRVSGLKPDCAVIVCTLRALKANSGKYKISPGRRLDIGLFKEDLLALKKGCANLKKHIDNIKKFGIPAVVVINKYDSDTKKEIDFVKDFALRNGALRSAESSVWRKGGKGGRDAAKAVIDACEEKPGFKYLYPLNAPIKKKIETIAKNMYGASSVRYTKKAEIKIRLFNKLKYDNMPVCMAKTHLSLSHDPKRKGVPRGFTLPVVDVRVSAGAGFIYPLCGSMRTMPGLPARPSGENMDIDDKATIKGLS